MIYPPNIGYYQDLTMKVLQQFGWQLLGFVESLDDYRFQEAVYKRNGQFKRVLPSGRVKINKPWNWRTDQDLTIIYLDYTPEFHIGHWRESYRKSRNRQRIIDKTSKIWEQSRLENQRIINTIS